ncbi:MAG: SCO family protein [Alphaproteobacteria bacterium]|uniref:SCO family protein n=1 Tax=Marinobacter salarius TaxID=1420917 RepID=UPI0032EABA2C
MPTAEIIGQATQCRSPVRWLSNWLGNPCWRAFMGFTTVAAGLALAMPVSAHHPGDDLDEVMGSREDFFQAVNKPAPPFSLRNARGEEITLDMFSDKVVVLNFVYTNCPDVCPLHAEKLAEVQAMINQSPMKDMVQFISITTDPTSDTPEVLDAYGPTHGLDAANWTFLTTRLGQSEEATRSLAEAFGHRFIKTDDGYQIHSVVTHVIDRQGRWAANFHGLRFESLNLVLYVNGLTNNVSAPPTANPKPGWWERLKNAF